MYYRRAFTLIEVAVVTLIIVMLAGILFPVFGSAREQARQTVCGSNLKQLYTAITLYADDIGWSGPLATVGAYPSRLKPYVTSEELFFCPDLPMTLRKGLGSSYVWRQIEPPTVPEDASEEQKKKVALGYEMLLKELERLGDNYPLLICTIHDELVYEPSMGGYDDYLSQEFVLEMRSNGSLYRGFMPYQKTRFIQTRLREKRQDVP